MVGRQLSVALLFTGLVMGPLGTDSQLLAGEREEADLRATFTALIKKRDHAGLLRAAEVVLTESPGSLPALEHRAFALQKLGRDRDAADAYSWVLKERPNHAWALTQLGWIETELGQHAASARHLRRAVELKPDSLNAHRKLVAALRAGGDLPAARTQLAATRAAGLDPGWIWREEAELAWMAGDLGEAEAALKKAESVGADDLARLREIVAFDRELLQSAADQKAFRAQRDKENTWELEVGDVRVRSTVGPSVPPEIERMLRELPERFADLVGGQQGRRRTGFVLRISRTTEQHEVLRRRYFPQGSRGRAFTGGVRASRGRGAASEIVIYVAWTASDIATSIAHEMGHAALRRATFGVPLWLDEGLATYLEKLRGRDDDPEPFRDDLRAELTRALRNRRVLSWADMLPAQRLDFEGANGRERYAQAWSMVRFLLTSDEMGADAAIRRERLRSLLAPGGTGRGFRVRVPVGRALIAATYGMSVAEIDAAWRRHIGAPKRD